MDDRRVDAPSSASRTEYCFRVFPVSTQGERNWNQTVSLLIGWHGEPR